jgi:hypothetical protein
MASAAGAGSGDASWAAFVDAVMTAAAALVVTTGIHLGLLYNWKHMNLLLKPFVWLCVNRR